MRITEKIIYDNMMNNLQLSIERLNKLSQKLISGKDINKPSDAPEKIGNIINIKNSIQNIEQYNKNINETVKFLEFSENRIDNMVQIFSQLKRIAIQGVNATFTIEERKILAQDVDNKLKEIISLVNSKLDDRYIFAGYKTLTKPFEEVLIGDVITDVVYNGDSGLMPEEIDKNEYINKNISGDNFKNVNFDIFKVVIELREHMKNDNIDGIKNNINEIDNIINKLIEYRTDIGGKLKRIENVENRLSTTKNIFYKIQSKLEDIDMPEIISEFQLQQNIYNNAILSIGKILQQTTLADVLK